MPPYLTSSLFKSYFTFRNIGLLQNFENLIANNSQKSTERFLLFSKAIGCMSFVTAIHHNRLSYFSTKSSIKPMTRMSRHLRLPPSYQNYIGLSQLHQYKISQHQLTYFQISDHTSKLRKNHAQHSKRSAT